MEKEPGGQHPEALEVKQEQLEDLFCGYGYLAEECGEFESRGVDAFPEPGEDDRLEQHGAQIWPTSLTIESDVLPESLRARGIDELDIIYDPPIIVDDVFENEQVTLVMHESGTGVSKSVGLSRDDEGELSAWSELVVDIEAKEDDYPEAGLDEDQIEEIYDRVEAGEHDILLDEGAEGFLARSVYLSGAEDEMYTNVIHPEDVNLLAEALPAIEIATLDHKRRP